MISKLRCIAAVAAGGVYACALQGQAVTHIPLATPASTLKQFVEDEARYGDAILYSIDAFEAPAWRLSPPGTGVPTGVPEGPGGGSLVAVEPGDYWRAPAERQVWWNAGEVEGYPAPNQRQAPTFADREAGGGFANAGAVR